jgi:GntR family transcriptional regulator
MDKKSPIPVYYQLAAEIRRKIDEGIWPPGHCIDSERILAEEYNLSRMTVRQAIGELVQAGILTREKGKGTFVCEPKIKQRDIMSFTEMMNEMGADFKTEVIAFERIEADEDKFTILNTDELYKIHRLRIVKDIIIAEEIIYIPCNYISDITAIQLKGSFYSLLDANGLSLDNSEASVHAILVNDYYKGLFRLTDDVPLLKVYSKNYDAEGKLLFVEQAVYRSDKYSLEINIARRKGRVK